MIDDLHRALKRIEQANTYLRHAGAGERADGKHPSAIDEALRRLVDAAELLRDQIMIHGHRRGGHDVK